MKSEPMQHQLVARGLLRDNPEYFALAAEQGTGKTWMLMDDAEEQFLCGNIDALFVIAPKGVHTNWVRREIPTHMSVDTYVDYWKSGSGVRHKRRIDKLAAGEVELEEGQLVVFAMNIDAINTKTGLAYAKRFLKQFDSMVVVDESHMIKNPDSKRSKKIVDQVAPLAKSRRIASGTLVAESPLDAFGQFEFLRPGLLGTTSYRTFVAEYAELHSENSNLVKDIKQRNPYADPQLVRTDKEGRPLYKNIEKLGRIMSPFTYRVTKKECLDLPEKIYSTHYYDLNPKQQKVYDRVAAEKRYERDDGELDIYTALTMQNKLRQLTSGFIMVEGAVERYEEIDWEEAEPRLKALAEVAEVGEGPMIIWASFKEELRQVAERLRDVGGRVAEYHGGIKNKDREAAIDNFQAGKLDFFVANPASGGTGLTLTAAERVAYYSCDFSATKRAQSEDRSHRIGTKNNVLYTDIVANGTIDEKIARVLQSKARDSATLMDIL